MFYRNSCRKCIEEELKVMTKIGNITRAILKFVLTYFIM